jgi:hypothetical protein
VIRSRDTSSLLLAFHKVKIVITSDFSHAVFSKETQPTIASISVKANDLSFCMSLFKGRFSADLALFKEFLIVLYLDLARISGERKLYAL